MKQAFSADLHLDSCNMGYNILRPHSSCNYLTPEQAHYTEGKLKSKWKKHDTAKKAPAAEALPL